MPSLVLPMTLGMAASGDPEVFHDFKVGQFPVDGTFSRSSTVNGWTLDANGDPVLSEFASGTPAFVIDPATGQSLGYRALQGFTNSLLWNRDLLAGPWQNEGTGSDYTLAQDATGADGVANKAWTVTDNSTDAVYSRRQGLTIPDDNTAYAALWLVEKDDDESRFPQITFNLTGGTPQTEALSFNTKTGDFLEMFNQGTYRVVDAGRWWLIVLTLTNNSTGNTTLRYKLTPAYTSTLGGGQDSSVTGSFVVDFPAVYSNSEIAGPPIETEGTPVSTAADDATEPLPASCQDGFVWVVHARISDAPNASADEAIGDINDGTSNNRVLLYRNGSDITLFSTSGGVGVANVSGGSVSPGDDIKVAVRVQENDFSICLNGGAVQKDTGGSFPSGLTDKPIGKDRTASGREWNSTITHEALYDNPADWTDADLQAETS